MSIIHWRGLQYVDCRRHREPEGGAQEPRVAELGRSRLARAAAEPPPLHPSGRPHAHSTKSFPAAPNSFSTPSDLVRTHANYLPRPLIMLTKFITGVTATFSPFNPRSGKTVRNFLALLPPNARSTMALNVNTLGRNEAAQPATLALKFSTWSRFA